MLLSCAIASNTAVRLEREGQRKPTRDSILCEAGREHNVSCNKTNADEERGNHRDLHGTCIVPTEESDRRISSLTVGAAPEAPNGLARATLQFSSGR